MSNKDSQSTPQSDDRRAISTGTARCRSVAVRNALARKRALKVELAEVNEFIELHYRFRRAGPYRENFSAVADQ